MAFLENLRKKGYNPKDEVLSGLTVALALVPEAVAFSIIANVSPLTGLYTAFIHPVCCSFNRADPYGRSGWTDVYGGYRNL